jgi:histidinol-phosphatase (PHP family)
MRTLNNWFKDNITGRYYNFASNMKWSNFHHHTLYDDGTKSVEEHVFTAIEQGVASMGFSGHCPVPFDNNWSMKRADLPLYFSDIVHAAQKFEDQIDIYTGLEVDYIPDIIDVNQSWVKELPLDYSVGSVHFVGAYENGHPWEIDGPHQIFLHGLQDIYHGDVKYVVEQYFHLTRQMVRNACPDVVGHLDKIKMQNRGLWNENESWYQNELLETLEEIKASNAIIEVNTRGVYKKLTPESYPGKWLLRQIKQMNIPIQLNSDAHHPGEITNNFPETAMLLREIGFKHLWIMINHQWQAVPFTEHGLIMD